MAIDEVTIKAIEDAFTKYNLRYNDDLYDAIERSVHKPSEIRATTLVLAASDCALLLCGHPLVSQWRWLDLFRLLLRETAATRHAVLRFLALFRDEPIA